MSTPTTAHDPVLPEAQMHLVKPTEPVTARIVSSDLCLKGKSASFVRHVCIDIGGTPLAGSFLAGQSFGIIPPGLDARGKPQKVRLYSLASPSWGEDGAGTVISTTPKRLIDERRPQKDGDDPDDHRLFLGMCSNYLCDLRPGDDVLVSGPNGKRFLLPTRTGEHDYLFLATGTGIAPFRGMLMELFDGPAGPTASQVHLVMGTPYTTDLLYDDLIRSYAEKHPNFHYHTAISRERRPDGRRGVYVHQLVEEHLETTFGALLASPRTLVYMCGLIGMQFGFFGLLAAHGLADGYLQIADAIAETPVAAWTPELMRRNVRSNARCMIEVY